MSGVPRNGWGGKDYRLEEFVRICHLFLPNTLLVLIYNRAPGCGIRPLFVTNLVVNPYKPLLSLFDTVFWVGRKSKLQLQTISDAKICLLFKYCSQEVLEGSILPFAVVRNHPKHPAVFSVLDF
eukprot:symbB.v1.2.007337.t1/scaffold425.1/size368629/1